jgi:tetraacyldisaccharide 4'-kinase
VIAIPADDLQLESELRAWGWDGPVWRLHRHIEIPRVSGSVVAFCGIARPKQFFVGLERAGIGLAARIAFRDHHRYTARDLDRLQAAAFSSRATGFITTRKDEIRLRSLSGGGGSPFLTSGLRVEIEDQSTALDWLTGQVHGSNPTRVSR